MTAIYLKWVEQEISRLKYGKSPSSLYDPIHYIMRLGGKRLRPLLVLLSYSLYKNDTRRVVPVAATVEAFHNFTLLHDDIMDNAPLRRGKKTVHEKWNVSTAILSGDVMLVKVYEQLLKVDQKLLQTVLARFNQCATEVCEGQQWDMEFEKKKMVSERDYIEMIRQKTAVLLGFSLELGGILAGASPPDQKKLRTVGVDMGIGFQLMDDWLDVFADGKKFGKQVGGDIIANKKTFLLINALSAAKGADKLELNKWLTKSKFNQREKVATVTGLYNKLNVGEKTQRKIDHYFKRALSTLDQLDVTENKKNILRSFILQLINRAS